MSTSPEIRTRTHKRCLKIVHACEIHRPRHELYAFWREAIGCAYMPAWCGVITQDVPNALIAWDARDGSHVPNRGVVRLEPGEDDNDTHVIMELFYEAEVPPVATSHWSGLLPGQEIVAAVQRLKALMRVGIQGTADFSHRSLAKIRSDRAAA